MHVNKLKFIRILSHKQMQGWRKVRSKITTKYHQCRYITRQRTGAIGATGTTGAGLTCIGLELTTVAAVTW